MDYAKAIVAERNDQELEYREEVNPFSDLLQCLGIYCRNKIVYTGGTINPQELPGIDAPIGSMYIRTSGEWYKKVGTDVTDWEIVNTDGSGGGPLYLKDLLDVDDNLSPELYNVLSWDGTEWTAKPICHPRMDYGLITQPVDCGFYDYGGLT